MVRYNDALDKDESGRSETREEVLLNKFPPEEEHLLTTPSVVIDSGGRIIVWYLPGALTSMMMVGPLSFIHFQLFFYLTRMHYLERYSRCHTFHEWFVEA
jgi:hypothetical protein